MRLHNVIDSFIEQYQNAEASFDALSQADCMLDVLDLMGGNNQLSAFETERALEFFNPRTKIILWAMLKALQLKRGDKALEYLQTFPDTLIAQPGWLPGYLFYRALAFYEQQQWKDAAYCFQNYLQKFPEDEMAYFYRGNCLAMQGDTLHALEEYSKSLEKKKTFFEAMANIGLLFGQLGDLDAVRKIMTNSFAERYMKKGRLVLYPWDGSLEIQETDMDEVRQIPIFINSRDRVECLKKLVSWLWGSGYHNIYILDNASTYSPLLSYYAALQEQGVNVILLSGNMGHRALWDSGVLESLQISTPYVYTDSDILMTEVCPEDFLQRGLKILRENPLLKKVGMGLIFEDITFYNKRFIQGIESQLYHIPIGENQYFAGVDTTFAVYRNYRHYSIYEAARLTGNYMAKHLPWYYDYDHLPQDEAYYLQHANQSSTLKLKL